MADFVCGCMILHDLFAEMVHQCSRLVGRWVIPQKSPNGSRVPNVPMAAAGSVHLEFVALAEPHLWLCQSQFGGSWTHQDDSQHAVARRKLLGQFLGVFFGVSTMVGLITPWPDQSGYRSQNAWAIVHECVPAPCSIIFPPTIPNFSSLQGKWKPPWIWSKKIWRSKQSYEQVTSPLMTLRLRTTWVGDQLREGVFDPKIPHTLW